MNIAGALSVSISFPLAPTLNAPAQVAPLTPGSGSAGTGQLDAFLSFLCDCDALGDISSANGIPTIPVASKPVQQIKKDRNPESPSGWFALVQMPQTDTSLPLTLTVPLSTPTDAGCGTSITAAQSTASKLTPADAGIPIIGTSTAETVLEKGRMVLTTRDPGLTLQAPIAFALKLDEIARAQDRSTLTFASPEAAETMVAQTREINGGLALAASEAAQALPTSIPVIKPKDQSEAPANYSPPADQPRVTLPTTEAALQSSLNPAQLPVVQAASEPTAAATAAADKLSQYGTLLATTKDGAKKQSPVPDGGLSSNVSAKQTETFTVPLLTQPVDGSRAEPGSPKDTNSRPMTMTDAQPLQPQGAAADGSNLPHATAAKEISIRLTPVESSAVDIKLVDRAGSVHVAVRTPNADLAETLQSGLSDLVHRLERRGFETETWSPKDGASPAAAQSSQANNNGSPSQQSKYPHDETQQGNPQQNNGRNRPKWVIELEQRLANEGEA